MADTDAVYTDGLGELTLMDGPWSLADAPEGREFIDFGPLRLPAIPTSRLRVEVDPARGEVGAVDVEIAECSVQLQVIAARAGERYWPHLRKQLIQNLRRRPGMQQVVEGHWGTEIVATVTGKTETGLWHDSTVRILGIDGDRWLLRAFVNGPGVTSDETIARVNAYLSQIAIDRGTQARAAGEVLPLTQPPGERHIEVPDDASSLIDGDS